MAMTVHSRNNRKRATRARPGRSSESYDRKLDAILRRAAAVFCHRGYHQASIRDIARATGVSLAGLYYYFSSKEELLYLIQRHAFETILAAAEQGIKQIESPEKRLRTLVRLHVQFFLDHPNEMKVLTHEEQWLGQARGREVRAIKRAYYRLCLQQVETLKDTWQLNKLNARVAVLSLFGMMNWIYTWYNSKIDPDATTCAETMAAIFLGGILGGAETKKNGVRTASDGKMANVDRLSGRRPRPPNGAGAAALPVFERSNVRAVQLQN
jgi:TetR/AcrR family transcriptional regulator, cholesterol catabolism regulator